MRLLVTGSRGQLARQFQRDADSTCHAVVAPPEDTLDITRPAQIRQAIERHRPDVLINCAAYNFVDRAESEFEQACRVNADGVRQLAVQCSRSNILLVHYGTDYVFDGAKEALYDEQDEPRPLNAYGRSKLLGEQALAAETDHFLLLRVSWVYGPGQQNFLYKLSQWARTNPVLKIVCDQLSVPTYTEDIVRVTLRAVERGLRGTYHLTNDGYGSRYEVARYFAERVGLDNLILPVTSGAFDMVAERPYFSAMSNRKLSVELGLCIPHWRDGIDRFVKAMT